MQSRMKDAIVIRGSVQFKVAQPIHGNSFKHGIKMQSVSGYLHDDIGSLTFRFTTGIAVWNFVTFAINLKMQMRKEELVNFSKTILCARTREAVLLYRLHLIFSWRRRDCLKIYAGIARKGGVMTFQLTGRSFQAR